MTDQPNALTEWARGPGTCILTVAVLEIERRLPFCDRAKALAAVDQAFTDSMDGEGPTVRQQLDLIDQAVVIARDLSDITPKRR